MFCGLCEDACPVDALELTQDFEMADLHPRRAIWDRQMLRRAHRQVQVLKRAARKPTRRRAG